MNKKLKFLALCPKCKNSLTQNKKYLSPGYFAACLSCDEDFYKIEVKQYEVINK